MYYNNMYCKWVDVRGQRVSSDKGFEVTGHYQRSLSRPPQLTEECGPSLATMLSVALSKYPRALLRLPCKSPALQKLCSSQAATELDGLFTTDEFVSRHIGPRDHDQTAMLDVLGFKVRYNILHLTLVTSQQRLVWLSVKEKTIVWVFNVKQLITSWPSRRLSKSWYYYYYQVMYFI